MNHKSICVSPLQELLICHSDMKAKPERLIVALPHLNVFEGLQFADVLAEEQQIQREVVPLAVRGGQNAHSGEQLVGFQEVGVAVAQQRTHAGVDDRRNEADEQDQVDQAGRGKHRRWWRKRRKHLE